MSARLYTKTHEWLSRDQGELVVGLTDYAQEQLGDVVFVELPEPGDTVEAGDEVVVLESVKAAGAIIAPASGRIVAVNEALRDEPELVNGQDESARWFLRIAPADEIDTGAFLSEDAYRATTAA